MQKTPYKQILYNTQKLSQLDQTKYKRQNIKHLEQNLGESLNDVGLNNVLVITAKA